MDGHPSKLVVAKQRHAIDGIVDTGETQKDQVFALAGEKRTK